ncbi:SPL family radical SAM protein [Thermospira aquatica]|uniref:Radical SAM protein n=1 Tax=Thermospira aquatica TaxID=2828656 RepID=A0AAX3BEM6_9SPIR|nr:radical SAM protein [Thermospira aquatica]URA10798.1 radical SAM protein [Thermospira aquatica]
MIQRLFIDPEVNPEESERIATRLGLEGQKATKEELVEQAKSLSLEERFRWGKSTLFLTRQKGRFLKKCPGSTGVVCCNYFTINTISGCPFDCSYCILQNYIENNPFITAFVNREDMAEEIEAHLARYGFLRVGTGELADSLALDGILEETTFFLEMITKRGWHDRITIEFKTKSEEIGTLLKAHETYPEVDVVVGFSVNIPRFITTDEHKTASLEQRIKAMKTLQQAGISIAIHFDPIVMIEDFLPHYVTLATDLFSILDQRLIRWISLGGYRHTVSLAPTIERRFPSSVLLAGEMFPSDADHKFRYLHPLRRHFYREMVQTIERVFPGAPLYLCMEKSFLWEEIGLSQEKCNECFYFAPR